MLPKKEAGMTFCNRRENKIHSGLVSQFGKVNLSHNLGGITDLDRLGCLTDTRKKESKKQLHLLNVY